MFALDSVAVAQKKCGAAVCFGRTGLVADARGRDATSCRPLPLPGWSEDTVPGPLAPRVPRPFARGAMAMMSCGHAHWAAATTLGTLWVGGSNRHGQLGFPVLFGPAHPDNNAEHFFVMRQHPICLDPECGEVRCESVACGAKHTLLVVRVEDEPHPRVLAAGENSRNQLGIRYTRCQDEFAHVETSMLNSIGPWDRTTRTEVKQIKIAAGEYYSVVAVNNVVGSTARDDDPPGRIRRLPQQPWQASSKIKHLVSGSAHVLVGALQAEEGGWTLKVYGWGANRRGQAGDPLSKAVIGEPQVVDLHFGTFADTSFPSLLAAKENTSYVMVGGKVWSFGGRVCRGKSPDSVMYVGNTPPFVVSSRYFDNEDVAFVSVGRTATAFTTTSGKVYMQGDYAYHRHEAGPPAENLIPTLVGREVRGRRVGTCRRGVLETPTAVPAEVLGSVAGDWALCLERKLAFVMGAHRRLCQGRAAGPSCVLLLDEALIGLILETLQKTMVRESPMLWSAGVFLE
jgi:alpha-tubulin suppressor-like RCC1 family protein